MTLKRLVPLYFAKTSPLAAAILRSTMPFSAPVLLDFKDQNIVIIGANPEFSVDREGLPSLANISLHN